MNDISFYGRVKLHTELNYLLRNIEHFLRYLNLNSIPSLPRMAQILDAVVPLNASSRKYP